jgi:TolA-binding protein
MFSNNYDPFDDFFGPSHFGTFSSPYEQRRRQELARRQKMEAERRRKAEFERRKLMELELAKEERRHELEMMRRQQQMMKEEETRRKKLAQAQQQRRSTYSPGSIVLGPDGNLYRVISPTADDEQLRRGEERSPVDKKRFSASDESKDNSDEQMILPKKKVNHFMRNLIPVSQENVVLTMSAQVIAMKIIFMMPSTHTQIQQLIPRLR